MASLEQLPPELFHQVASYLAFVDKKALAAVSNQLHTYLGPISCPDQLSWIIHCCHSPSPEANNPVLLHPDIVLEHLRTMRRKLNCFRHWHLHDSGGLLDTNNIKWYDGKLPGKSLLMPYFKDSFPNSTLACFYFHTIHGFAASAISLSGCKTRSNSTYGKSTATWRQIELESGWSLTWLRQRRPAPRYLVGISDQKYL